MTDKNWDHLPIEERISRLKSFLKSISTEDYVAPTMVVFNELCPSNIPQGNTLQNQFGLLFKQIVAALGFIPTMSNPEPHPMCDCGLDIITTYALVEIYRPGTARNDGTSDLSQSTISMIPMCQDCFLDHIKLEAEHHIKLKELSRGSDGPEREWSDPLGFLFDNLSGGDRWEKQKRS